MGDAAAAQDYRFRQSVTFWELLGLSARNAALGLLTLTLFRFWARTNVRRRLWARTSIMGDPLEYTGKSSELVRGFLISLPTFFLPAIFAVNIAPLAFDRGTAALVGMGFYCAAVPVIAAGRFWMRRYQLSRTRWRGIRFALDGSAWSFSFASSGWTLLQMITLGWYTPAARIKRARLMWSQTRFGDQPFTFAKDEADALKGLYGPFALGWFGSPIGFGVGASIGASVGLMIGTLLVGLRLISAQPGNDLGLPQGGPIMFAVFGVFVFACAIAFAALTWVPYVTASMKRIASLIELDGARFELRVSAVGLALTTMACALIFIFSIGLLAPLSGALYMRYVLNHLEMSGEPRFAEIGQPLAAGPGSAEGTVDAFDLDFGIGIV